MNPRNSQVFVPEEEEKGFVLDITPLNVQSIRCDIIWAMQT